MKRFLFLIVLLGVAGAAFALWRVWGERYEIVLTREQIGEQLARKFPFEKTHLFIIHLRFFDPRVSLIEGSRRIGFGCSVESAIEVELKPGEGAPGPLAGSADLSGELRYDPSEGAFFLDQPVVEKLSISGLPERFTSKVEAGAAKVAAEFLQRTPVYRLKSTDVKQAAAKLILKDVVVTDGKLVITLGVGG